MAKFLLVLTVLIIIVMGLAKLGALDGVSLEGIPLTSNPEALDAQARQLQAQAQAQRQWSASATRTAAEERARMTQVAVQVIGQQTAQAQATQEQFAREVIGWTATADAGNSTATMAAQQTATMKADIIATQTAEVEQAKREREAVMQNFVADFKMIFWPVVVPSVILILFVFAAGYGFWRWIRKATGTVETHEHGFIYDRDTQKSIKPSLQPTAVMDIRKPAQPSEVEQKIMDNHQKIGLARELARAGQVAPVPNTGGFQIIPPDKMPPLLEDPNIVDSAMNDDWSKNGSAN